MPNATPGHVDGEPGPSPAGLSSIAFVGSYVPRRCGIATFTRDLRAAVVARLPRAACPVVPLHDAADALEYPPEVRFECDAAEPAAYARAAEFLNLANVDVVSLQHEYGIFGGPDGEHVLTLLDELRMPVHTTLHTVLARPTPGQRRVLDGVIARSSRLAVMTDRGRDLVRAVHGVAAERIDVIPHGIPDAPPPDPARAKAGLGLGRSDVLLTFGLLSPNKGIETVIAALPEIVARHPRVVYVVLGATHPRLLRDRGEGYRTTLEALAVRLGVRDHVVFHDRYVTLAELLEFLAAADIYLTPYHDEEQATSGTLAYAFGCGKAVVSTPYGHARELLAGGRGVLVPFRDPVAIAREVSRLLDDADLREGLGTAARRLGREMTWSRVAARYVAALRAARAAATVRPRRPVVATCTRLPRRDVPRPVLRHLWRLTDATGLVQHATFDVPNLTEGYCTDDNARALTLMVRLDELGERTAEIDRATAIYAAFLGHAYEPTTGRFRNLMGFDRRWLDDRGSDDCLGRAVLALGACIGRSRLPNLRRWASRFFEPAARAVVATTSLRAWALGILGLQDYLSRLPGDRLVRSLRDTLVERLLDVHRHTAAADWPWFEDVLAYDNARPCEALITVGHAAPHAAALATGLASLDWLAGVQRAATGRFAPVGCRGFHRRGGTPARFDQQPLEAHATIAACTAAHRATGDPVWLDRAWNAFDWFHGHNVLGVGLCDPHTGGCRDGLHEDRANENQGAESTLAYLGAVVEMRRVIAVCPPPPDRPTAAVGRPAAEPPPCP